MRSVLVLATVSLVGVGLVGCPSLGRDLRPEANSEVVTAEAIASPSPLTASPTPIPTLAPTPLPRRAWLDESWAAYTNRFIQADGRVIDFEAEDRTVSEGQAYAMLRAVLIDDRDTFERTLTWAENNLRRDRPQNLNSETNLSDAPDSLWLWKWGPNPDGTWRIIDANFATDADIDAVTALIWAHRRWQEPRYLDLAREKLADIWDLGTVLSASGRRYLIPGPIAAFQPSPEAVWLNPSYFAPYAFRLFAQIDPERDWQSLVDSSYFALEQVTALSEVNLPPDWVLVDPSTDRFSLATASSPFRSHYSFDAIRVWWRLAWDAAFFQDPRAIAYLETNLQYFQDRWPEPIFATITSQGDATVDYEATAQFGMLYLGLSQVNAELAARIESDKLWPTYTAGIWDNDRAYYTQNLAWLGLFPTTDIPASLLR